MAGSMFRKISYLMADSGVVSGMTWKLEKSQE
jgi:hypothetical protein